MIKVGPLQSSEIREFPWLVRRHKSLGGDGTDGWCACSSVATAKPAAATTAAPCTVPSGKPFRSQTTIEPIRPALRLLHHRFPESFSSRQHTLNFHNRFLTGGFLQTAVSDAPRHKEEQDVADFVENDSREVDHVTMFGR